MAQVLQGGATRSSWLTGLLALVIGGAASCSSSTAPPSETTESQSGAITACGNPFVLNNAFIYPAIYAPSSVSQTYSIRGAILPTKLWVGSNNVSNFETIHGTLTFTGGPSSVTCTYAGTRVYQQPLTELGFSSCTNGATPGASIPSTMASLSGYTETSTAYISASNIYTTPDDGSTCTIDQCVAGNPNYATFAPAGTSCDDGLVCNGTSVCNASGACNPGAPPSADDGDPCTDPVQCTEPYGWTYTHNASCTNPPGVHALPADQLAGITKFEDRVAGLNPQGTVASRVAVIRGRAILRNGNPTPQPFVGGATVSLVGHPEHGTVLTRSDGWFEIAVNGGETYTVQLAAAGQVTIQRKAETHWHDFTVIPDVAFTPLEGPMSDGLTTTVTLNALTWQVRRGPLITQAVGGDGDRQAMLLIPPGTHFTNWTPSGDPVFRATELTVGPRGPAAMPGELPYQSAYTYAVDLSVDNAPVQQSLTFFTPVYFYVQNFTDKTGGLPNYTHTPNGGVPIPTGSYDPTTGTWKTDQSGKMYRYLGVTGGGLARLSVDGTAEVGDYTAEGILDGERQTLAGQYAPNTDLWRVPMTHFTTYDLNQPGGAPSDARGPTTKPPKVDTPKPPRESCEAPVGGSIVECSNQVLGEAFPIVGTPFSLHYRTETQNGYRPTITIPITDDSGFSVPDGGVPVVPTRIEVEVIAAGQRKVLTALPPFTANQSLSWTWDRNDAWGNPVQGTVYAHVSVNNIYPVTESNYTTNFGSFGTGFAFGGSRDAREVYLTRRYDIPVGGLDAKYLGLGGLTLSANHVMERDSGVVWYGYGDKRANTAWPDLVDRAYKGAPCGDFYDIAASPEGTIYASCDSPNRHLYTVTSSTLTRLDGPDVGAPFISNGQSFGTFTTTPSRIAFGPDGKLYVGDRNLHRLLRVERGGSLATTLIAGRFDGAAQTNAAADNVQAVGTTFGDIGPMAVGADGSIFFAENGADRHLIRRIRTDGMTGAGTVETLAGAGPTPLNLIFDSDSPLASSLSLDPIVALALDDKGALLFVAGDNRLWRFLPSGRLERLAGSGSVSAETGDGGPALLAGLESVRSIVARGGAIYLAGYSGVRRISSGVITRVLGGGVGVYADGKPATDVSLYVPGTVSVTASPDGRMYAGTMLAGVGSLLSFGGITDMTQGGYTLVPEADGSVVYKFDAAGKHQATVSGLRGADLYKFQYTSSGKLAMISDMTVPVSVPSTSDVVISYGGVQGCSTTVSIAAYYGQTTTLCLNSSGYVTDLGDPNGNHTYFSYHPQLPGLIASLTDPKGQIHSFSYSGTGLLVNDKNPIQGTGGLKLSRTDTPSGVDVSLTTPESRVTTHSISTSDPTKYVHTTTGPDGLASTFQRNLDRSTTWSGPALAGNTNTTTTKSAIDPRLGFSVSYPSLSTRVTHGSGANKVDVTTTRSVNNPGASDPFAVTTITDTVDPAATTGDDLGATSVVVTKGASTSTVASTSALGRASTVTLDSRDRPIAGSTAGVIPNITLTQPASTTSITYDHGRVQSVTQSGVLPVVGTQLRTLNVNYNGATGRVDSVVTPLGQVTYMNYDGAGRPLQIKLPGGTNRLVNLTYDNNGNPLTVATTQPFTKTHTFSANVVDLLGTYTPPSIVGPSGSTTYQFDRDSLLTSVSEPQDTVTILRDGAGRISSTSMGTPFGTDQRIVGYDGAGHVSNIISTVGGGAGVALSYTYDGERLSQESMSIPGGGLHTVDWTADDFDRPKTRTIDGALQATFSYDADGYLAQVNAGSYTYVVNRESSPGVPSAGGLVSSTTLNGLTDTYQYDAFGALREYKVTGPLGPNDVKYDVIYERYPTTGRVKRKDETIAGLGPDSCYMTYDYDDRNFLSTENGTCPWPAVTIPHDDSGNLTVSSYVYDAQDRLTSENGWNFTYNGDGDAVNETSSSDPLWSWSFLTDVAGNLRKYYNPMNSGYRTRTYDIDGLDRRVGFKDNNQQVASFLYSGRRVVGMIRATGPAAGASHFVYGTKSNVPDLLVRADGVYRIISDELGTVKMVIKQDGTIVERHQYNTSGVPVLGDAFNYTPFGFAGGLWDDYANLVRFGAREYNPWQWRWWSKDPSRFAGGLNLYEYANNDPVNFIDPSGLITFNLGISVSGGAGTFLGVGGQFEIGVAIDLPSILPSTWGIALYKTVGWASPGVTNSFFAGHGYGVSVVQGACASGTFFGRGLEVGFETPTPQTWGLMDFGFALQLDNRTGAFQGITESIGAGPGWNLHGFQTDTTPLFGGPAPF